MYHQGQGIAYSVQGRAEDTIGNAVACVIHSSMNTAAKEILIDIKYLYFK